MNFNFPFKLWPKVLYVSAYHNQIFTVCVYARFQHDYVTIPVTNEVVR